MAGSESLNIVPHSPGKDSRKVLVTTDAVGGVWQYTFNLVSQLAAKGQQTLVANLGPAPTPEQENALASLPGVSFRQGDYPLEWMEAPWSAVDDGGEWLFKLGKQFNPDLVHLNGFCYASLPWEQPTLVVAHSCVYSWWRAVHGCEPPQRWCEYHRRVQKGLSAAGTIVAPTRAMARAVEREYHLSSRPVRVISNFVTAQPITAKTKEPSVLAAGRAWDKAKNIALLQSLSRACSWPIKVAGDLQSQSSMSDHLHWLGPLPHKQLLAEMAQSSVFAHPALYEPFGLAVLEAAQQSCCLLLADIPSLRELWDGAAIFADPRNLQQWQASLSELANNPEQVAVLGSRARQRAMYYTADASIVRYEAAYEDLLANASERVAC